MPRAMPSAVVLVALAAGSMTVMAAPANPLSVYRWTSRVLLVSAPSDRDPDVVAQRRLYAGMLNGARERDLVLVEAIGPSPAAVALRARFDLNPGSFQVVLIGKDGGEKLRSGTGLGPQQLFPLIDAMPMRRRELGER